MDFLGISNGFFINFLWIFYKFFVDFFGEFCGFFVNFLWIFYKFFMDFLKIFVDFLWILWRFCEFFCGFFGDFLWIFYGFLFLWSMMKKLFKICGKISGCSHFSVGKFFQILLLIGSFHRTISGSSGRARSRSGSETQGSPNTFEELMNMVPPELSQEVLLEKEHNDCLSKLVFVRHLVQCIIEVAKTRDTPIRFAGENGQTFDALQRFNVTSISQKSDLFQPFLPFFPRKNNGKLFIMFVLFSAGGRKNWFFTGRVCKLCRPRWVTPGTSTLRNGFNHRTRWNWVRSINQSINHSTTHMHNQSINQSFNNTHA